MNRRKLHEEARRAIERLIADRGIKAGSRIPTESKLAGELYVSRTTIRRALKDLEQEGKIEHAPGGVTIVRQTRSKTETRLAIPEKNTLPLIGALCPVQALRFVCPIGSKNQSESATPNKNRFVRRGLRGESRIPLPERSR